VFRRSSKTTFSRHPSLLLPPIMEQESLASSVGSMRRCSQSFAVVPTSVGLIYAFDLFARQFPSDWERNSRLVASFTTCYYQNEFLIGPPQPVCDAHTFRIARAAARRRGSGDRRLRDKLNHRTNQVSAQNILIDFTAPIQKMDHSRMAVIRRRSAISVVLLLVSHQRSAISPRRLRTTSHLLAVVAWAP
jgi:hypothetical protein